MIRLTYYDIALCVCRLVATFVDPVSLETYGASRLIPFISGQGCGQSVFARFDAVFSQGHLFKHKRKHSLETAAGSIQLCTRQE